MQTRFEAIVDSLPIVFLGACLIALFWAPLPETNRDIAIAIVSGLLGYLKSRGENRVNSPTITANDDARVDS